MEDKKQDGVGVEEATQIEVVTPTFTISADSKFGMACMIAISKLAHLLPLGERALIAETVREFELFYDGKKGSE